MSDGIRVEHARAEVSAEAIEGWLARQALEVILPEFDLVVSEAALVRLLRGGEAEAPAAPRRVELALQPGAVTITLAPAPEDRPPLRLRLPIRGATVEVLPGALRLRSTP